MTLRDYLKIFWQRLWVILAVTVLAAGVVFLVTPARASDEPPVSSYTATATLLATSEKEPLGRIALFVTTGDIPVKAAKKLDFADDPALLVQQVTVESDPVSNSITISATDADAKVATARANAFADATVDQFSGRKGTKVELLQAATPIPNKPLGGAVVPPNRWVRTGLGAAVGLILGMALAIVLDHLDSSLRTREEIAAATGLPIIASVPKLPRSERRSHAILTHTTPLSAYADGYRAARSALRHALPPDSSAGGGRVFLVTSALAGEGKTTSAANIAASFAETGQNVIAIDADFRKPDLNLMFDVPQGAGASDFLVDHTSAQRLGIVRPTNVDRVKIITAGTQLDHPASLTSRMGSLVKAARQNADVVIIDASPILVASDAFDLLPLVDAVALVSRSRKLTDVAAARVAELLGRFDVPVAGIVVVGAPADAAAGYGYGYGYGYGQDRRSKRKGRKDTPVEPAPTPAAPPAPTPAPSRPLTDAAPHPDAQPGSTGVTPARRAKSD